jgi:hypothetical protein
LNYSSSVLVLVPFVDSPLPLPSLLAALFRLTPFDTSLILGSGVDTSAGVLLVVVGASDEALVDAAPGSSACSSG